MPRWPDTDGLVVTRLDGFEADGPPTDAEDRVFRLTFDAAPAADDERVVLAFDGIATVFEVSLNGSVILRGDSMFLAHEVDVGGLLRAGGNELVVRCRALDSVLADVPRRPRQRWRTRVVPDGALRFVRTTVLGRAPGFAPGPPVVGPWRPVWLLRRRGPQVSELRLRPRLEGGDGILVVSGHVEGASRVAVECGGARTETTAGDRFAAELRLPDVGLWCPHTHGEPLLYDVTLRLDDEVVVGAGRVGFRALENADSDSVSLVVNGVPVFCRGAVWTPVPEDEVRSTLETLRDAGMNMVRVAGIGVYETEAFHDLCDELGMLVWQDFMYANLDYPVEDDAFRAAAEAEARQVLARVCGRPSTAVLCGNSEVEQQAAMFGVDPAVGRGELFGQLLPRWSREAGADVPYVPSAPCGGAMPFHPGAGVANYFGVGGYRRPLGDARAAGVRFASECLALANVPDDDVADGEGVPRDVGADWDFADVRDHYLRELHGVDAAALPRDRYLALSRVVSGEVMAATFGEWRRTASPCSGALVLWARDLMPGAAWGVLDHRGAPKVALAMLARVLAPRTVWIVDEGLGGLDVWIANDGPDALDAELHVALLADGAHVIADGMVPVHAAPHETVCHNAEGVLGRFADASYAYRFGPPAHDTVVATLRAGGGAVLAQAVHFPLGTPIEPRDDLGLTATATPDGRVTLATERVAYGVRVAAPGFVADDDAFALVPGTPRTVTLRSSAGAPFTGATVTALNLSAPVAPGPA